MELRILARLRWIKPHECTLHLKTIGSESYFLCLKRVDTRYGARVLFKLMSKSKRSVHYEDLFTEFLDPSEARELSDALLTLVSDVERRPLDIVREVKRKIEILEDMLR
ncbi:MAG: hypothetical protein DRN53_04150 [Thermoprotei archaeon]|nr:MAG: hypothetical protein DRN53_04150 [Thermoprotei archaeon]